MPSISVSRVRIRQVSIRVDRRGQPARRRDHGQRLRPADDAGRDRRARRVRRRRTRSAIVSAHRTPDVMFEYARGAADRGLRVIIAGAGGAAHLPGMTASMTPLPVIGVPVPLAQLDGLDSLLSIVQMPAGIPVATVAIGNARNAGPARGAHPRRTATRSCAPRWCATRPTSPSRCATRTPSCASSRLTAELAARYSLDRLEHVEPRRAPGRAGSPRPASRTPRSRR